jgi:hypothetical protein
VVVTFGDAAFLAHPAIVGFLVNHLGLHHTMAVPAILCAGIIGLAATMPKNDARALELVAERWAPLSVRDLVVGPRRYGELSSERPGESAP